MKLQYTSPEFEIIKFETEDIITESGSTITVETNQPITFDNATALTQQTFAVFE